MRFILFIFFLFNYLSDLYSQNRSDDVLIDSILTLRAKAYNDSNDIKDRIRFAEQAKQLALEYGQDTTLLSTNKHLASVYFLNDDLDKYRSINVENLGIAKALKDSASIANINHNLGYYYHTTQQNDSAYYFYSRALELYDALQQENNMSSVLINVANIQQVENDFIGAESNAIKAIEILQRLPSSESTLDDLWILYNLLGINALKLKLYSKSLDYHGEALKISNKMRTGEYNRLYTQNNLAFVYRKLGDLDKAISLYTTILEQENLYDEDPSFYALILENIAYTKFINGSADHSELESQFKRAYTISDSIDDPITKVGVTISMSKFYKGLNDNEKAINYAEETYKIAKDIESNDILFESLYLLSELKTGESGKAYLREHIKLSDSLLNVERNVRNKYARIEFETDQIEAENQRISQQRMWLFIVACVLLVTLFLLYVTITQRAKNKELQFEKDQQKANEEIYNLMLSQQDKVDEARANEKKRISQEIHDGILGRLFGTRLSLDSLNLSDGKDAVNSRAEYIKELMTIENDIRKISHDLNTDFVAGSGFMDILSELIIKQTTAYQLKYQFNYTDDVSWESISNKDKINIYRIIQESMQNIYKHAEASEVKISIESKNNVILITIADDGKGFDLSRSKKGIGLKNINSRVKDLGGTVDFQSEIGKGTAITINIPYKSDQ